MFKLVKKSVFAFIASTAVVLFVACGSTPAAQPTTTTKKETTAEAAQRAREAADDAMFSNFGTHVSTGKTTTTSTTTSGAAAEAQAKAEAEAQAKADAEAQAKADAEAQAAAEAQAQADAQAQVATATTAASTEPVVNKSSTEPSWVKKPQTGANQNLFLSATGMGKRTSEAETAATAALVKIIRQDISSKTVTTDKASMTNGISKSKSTLDETVEQESMMKTLVGVQIKEIWTAKNGTAYALAVLNKADASEYYKNKIAEVEATVLEMIADAEKQSTTFDGYFGMKKAAQLADEVTTYVDVLFAVDRAAYNNTKLSFGSVQAIEKKATDIASKLSLSVNVKGDVNGRAGTAIAKVFSNYGFDAAIDKNERYILEADLSFEDVPSSRNAFVRYVLDARLKDTKTGKVIFPFSSNAREGHKTSSEAKQLCIRTLEKNINTKFAEAFEAFVIGE